MTQGCEGYFSFATVTDGCKEGNFMGFFHYIHENELTSENIYFPMSLVKKGQFHVSFFKVDSKNFKFSLEYLLSFEHFYVYHLQIKLHLPHALAVSRAVLK